MKNKKTVYTSIGIFILIVTLLVLGFSNGESSKIQANNPAGNWFDLQLEDVSTGEGFKISDFEGKPILVESFAVWCPTCTRQQNEIKELHEDPEFGESFISISLNTDPNEDKEIVLDHIKRNGFDWRYSISPIELTQSLIDQFGVGVINAPSVPIVLICDSENTRMLDSGLKNIEKLKSELSTCN